MQPSQSTAKSMNVMYAWAWVSARMEMQEGGAVLGLC